MEVKMNVQNIEGKEMHIRTGELPAPFEVKPITILGNINAPQEYHRKREHLFEEGFDNAYVVLKKAKSEVPVSIELVYNSQKEDTVTVKGVLTYNPDYTQFGINQNRKYDLRGLITLIKKNRPFFESVTEYQVMLNNLKNFTAKTDTEFTSNNDYKGNIAYKKIESCKTNLNYDFNLLLPIFNGGKKHSLKVEVEFEPQDGSIVAWLVSTEAQIAEIEELQAIYDTQLEYFQKVKVPIPIIEQ